ncbi:sigma-70 family RNA polymerase sigma factor [Streptomyces sp. NPDC051582]|uniref:sigma-70 family RNA polymerase sigma factor n=1 Tax=Streptomyces sp. NPDC051582 TaxID=3155167 RepID=UPI0034195885
MITRDPAPLADFEEHRLRMFAIAYRMLGSAAEAEDTVQDAWLRWSSAGREDVEHPGAWLAKAVTRLCLNRLTSARARREEYAGPWLPEPVLTGDGALGPLESAEQRDGVSIALLVLLERLTPVERAVYVLREAFAYGHREIAVLLGLTESHCRQLYRRAAVKVETGRAETGRAETGRAGAGGAGSLSRRRFEPDRAQWQNLVETFLTAAREGDLARLESMLSADVRYVADGGGIVSAARRPILGREKVARFLVGALRKYGAGLPISLAEVNAEPALLFGGAVVLQVEFEDGLVRGVRSMANPEKLEFLQRQLSHSLGLSGRSW